MDRDQLLHTIIEASIEAGKEIMQVYETDFDVEIKGDNSPLTIADKNANTVINSYLKTTNIPIISEENKQLPYSDREKWNVCWIVDPVDGTKEFIKRNGEFTVNIALVENGIPVLGVIYIPVSQTLYFTNSSCTQSYKTVVDVENIGIPSLINNAEEIYPVKHEGGEEMKVVGSRSHLNEETKLFVKKIEEDHDVKIVSKGSSLKFCLVAEGAAHVYPRFAPTMEWDTAAGQAICKAVGITVMDVTTNEPLAYNKENLLNPFFVVK